MQQRNSPKRSPVPNPLVPPPPLAAPSPQAPVPVLLPPVRLPLATKRPPPFVPSFPFPPFRSSSFFAFSLSHPLRLLPQHPLPLILQLRFFSAWYSTTTLSPSHRRTKRRGVSKEGAPPSIIPSRCPFSSFLSLSFLVGLFCNMYSVAQFSSLRWRERVFERKERRKWKRERTGFLLALALFRSKGRRRRPRAAPAADQ